MRSFTDTLRRSAHLTAWSRRSIASDEEKIRLRTASASTPAEAGIPGSQYDLAMPRLGQISRSDDNPPIVKTMYSLLFDDRDPVSEP